jgi:hypothetical protein
MKTGNQSTKGGEIMGLLSGMMGSAGAVAPEKKMIEAGFRIP